MQGRGVVAMTHLSISPSQSSTYGGQPHARSLLEEEECEASVQKGASSYYAREMCEGTSTHILQRLRVCDVKNLPGAAQHKHTHTH